MDAKSVFRKWRLSSNRQAPYQMGTLGAWLPTTRDALIRTCVETICMFVINIGFTNIGIIAYVSISRSVMSEITDYDSSTWLTVSPEVSSPLYQQD